MLSKTKLSIILIIFSLLSSFLLIKPLYSTEVFKNDKNSLDISGRLALMQQSGHSDGAMNDASSRLQFSFSSYDIDNVTVKGVTLWGLSSQDKYTKSESFLMNRETYVEVSNDFYGKIKLGKFTNVISDNVLLKTDKTYIAKIDSGLTNKMPDGEGSDYSQWRLRKAIAYENNIDILKFGYQYQGNQDLINKKYSSGGYLNVDNKIVSLAIGYNTSKFDDFSSDQYLIGTSLTLSDFYVGLTSGYYNNLYEYDLGQYKSYSIYTSYQIYKVKPYVAYEEIIDADKELTAGIIYTPSKSLWLILESSRLFVTNKYLTSFIVRYNI
jgi:hypothetical protein